MKKKFQLKKFLGLTVNTPLRTAIPIVILFIAALIPAIPAYHKLDGGAVNHLSLDASPEEWARRLGDGDPGGYLDIGNNLVNGRGFSRKCESCNPPGYYPTDYWGPGAPVGFAIALGLGKIFHVESMKVIFGFVFFLDVMVGFILLKTFWLFSRNFLSSLIVAMFCGFCPPLQGFQYSEYLTSSEVINALPIAATFYFLAKSFKVFWEKSKVARVDFALAGLFLGLSALVRESNFQFTWFTVFLFLAEVFIRRKNMLKPAALACVLFFISAFLPRIMTQQWNQYRTGNAIVGRAGLVPKIQYFSKYEGLYYQTIGFAMGDYLDPEATKRVEQAYAEGRGSNLLVYRELIQAVLKRPYDAVMFKIHRLPILFLGFSDRWPNLVLSFQTAWTISLYLIFFSFLGYSISKRRWPSEVTYFYFVFMVLCSALIHAEFRYSFPVLIILKMIPGLFLAQWLADKRLDRV